MVMGISDVHYFSTSSHLNLCTTYNLQMWGLFQKRFFTEMTSPTLTLNLSGNYASKHLNKLHT